MAGVQAFRALRYNPQRIPDLGPVLAPPYDVIDEAEQERLYQASPYNLVRLTLGTQSPEDTEADNRYTRARRDFDAWQREGILRADPQPALYLIGHTFTENGVARTRLGFIALLELNDAMKQVAYRHEATLAAPKADRTKLLAAVPANLEPIFCIYPDAGGAIQSPLQAYAAGTKPAAQVVFKGEMIRIWMLTDSRLIQDLARRLAPVTMLIADGHHRFEVAYAHRRRYGAVMSYFVSMAEPALMVRPIHRVVLQRPASLERLRGLCDIKPASNLDALSQWLREGNGQGRFGSYDGRALCQVTVHPDRVARWLMNPSVPLPIAALDVSLLHGLVLPSLQLDSSSSTPTTEGVRYTANAAEALTMVDRGEGGLAWLLRGLSLPQVYAIASQGLVLPPKSTYFYPKVPSGLAINPLI